MLYNVIFSHARIANSVVDHSFYANSNRVYGNISNSISYISLADKTIYTPVIIYLLIVLTNITIYTPLSIYCLIRLPIILNVIGCHSMIANSVVDHSINANSNGVYGNIQNSILYHEF